MKLCQKIDFFILLFFLAQRDVSEFSCNGRYGSFSTEFGCNTYFSCDGSARTPQLKTCPKHHNFHPHSKKCVWSYSFSCEGIGFILYFLLIRSYLDKDCAQLVKKIRNLIYSFILRTRGQITNIFSYSSSLITIPMDDFRGVATSMEESVNVIDKFSKGC